MPRFSTPATDARYSQCVLACLAVAVLLIVGCQPPAPPQTDPEPVEVAPPPKPAPKPEETPPPPSGPLRIAILTSCANPEYAAVKDALIEIAGSENVELFDLGSSAIDARAAIDSLRDHGHDNVVAIGLLAARATHRLDAEKVVFCQVLNHGEYDLLGPRRRGILALPPLREAAELLRSMNPSTTRIGVISGAGHEDMVAHARQDFEAVNIELIHRVTSSDKETVLELQRMLPEIQAYWLLPDNRVLSRTALRDLMSLARRSKVGVLVNDARFLDLGAVLSAANDASEIAERAYQILLEDQGKSVFSETGMSWPRMSVLRLSPSTALALGYELDAVPEHFHAR